MGGGVRRVSVVEAGRQGLVEVEVGVGLSGPGVEGGSLIEKEIAPSRASWGEKMPMGVTGAPGTGLVFPGDADFAYSTPFSIRSNSQSSRNLANWPSSVTRL